MLIAVISGGIGLTGNGNNNFCINSSDRQRAGLRCYSKLIGHIVTSSILHYCSAGYFYGILTSIDALAFSSQARNGVLLTIDRELIVHKACDLLFLAIVGQRVAVGFYRDLQFVLPDSIQIVVALCADIEWSTYLIFHRLAVFYGGPACKPFVLRGLEVQVRTGRVFRGLLTVGLHRERLRGAAVVISQRQVFRRFAVHSRQRYITRYGDGLAGQKRGIVVQLPMLELQAFAVLRVENGCLAALCILCEIIPFCAVFIISDRTLGGIAYVIGRQGDIFIQLSVQIEDHAVNHPCIRLQLFCQSIPLSGITQLAAVRHRDLLVGAILHGNGHGDLRGCPFCIQRNVFGGHGALKLKCIALAQLVCIPASELIVGRNIIRFFRLVVYIRNGLLELAAFLVNDRFAAIENDVIAVAGIVELCVIVPSAYLGADVLYQSKTGNGISVFFGNPIAGSGRSVLMMQLIYSAIRSLFTAFVGQNLNIVIGGFAAITRLGAIEVFAAHGHRVNMHLPRSFGHIGVDTPCAAGPFLRDICPIFGFDGMRQLPAVIRMSVFFLPAY